MKNKILIIDDSKEILFAISEFFKIKGWQVFTATSVDSALKIINSEFLNIIIIDYHMPYINGVLGVKLIRQIDKTVPIIALTIEGLENVANDFFEAGANDFSIKPIKVLDLYSRVQVHLKNFHSSKNKTEKKLVNEYHKGINENTINLIKNELKKTTNYVDIEYISKKTGLATQTVNRYMNHLVKLNIVEVKIIYGKIGRPKNKYFLRK